MPTWTFWLLIGIVVCLVVVILVRDKGIRQGIKNFFKGIKEKLRVARIKSAIGKENLKLKELFKNLGETAFKQGLAVPGCEQEKGQADKLTGDLSGMEKSIADLDGQVEKNKKERDDFNAKQAASIKEAEGQKEPLVKEFNTHKKEASNRQETVSDKGKDKEKLQKKIASAQEKIREIDNKGAAATPEDANKKTELAESIKQMTGTIQELDQAMAVLQGEIPAFTAKTEELAPRIKALEDQIKTLKEKQKEQEKKSDALIDELQKKKSALVSQANTAKGQLGNLFTQVGEKLNTNRIENSALTPLYQQVDQVVKAIGDLENQIKTAPAGDTPPPKTQD